MRRYPQCRPALNLHDLLRGDAIVCCQACVGKTIKASKFILTLAIIQTDALHGIDTIDLWAAGDGENVARRGKSQIDTACSAALPDARQLPLAWRPACRGNTFFAAATLFLASPTLVFALLHLSLRSCSFEAQMQQSSRCGLGL